MLKKEVGAIFAALLLVATLGVGVATASGVVIGGGYNDTSVDMSSSSFSDFFTTDLWNGTFWDYVAEEGVEEAAAAEAEAEESPFFVGPVWNGSFWDYVAEEEVEAVKKARDARDVNETAEAEEADSLWLPGDKTSWPAGYWEVDPTYRTHWPAGYWDVNWIIPLP